MLLTLIRPQSILVLSLLCSVFAACASSGDRGGDVSTDDTQIYATVDVAVEVRDDQYYARAVVEVFDAFGQPVAGASVHGYFNRGDELSAVTDKRGIATLVSPALVDNPHVTFQLDAVSHERGDGMIVAEQPNGVLFKDECDCGIATSSSTSDPRCDCGISTSSSQEPAGGISTSSSQEPAGGIATSS